MIHKFLKHEKERLQVFNVLKNIIYLLDYFQTYPNVKLIYYLKYILQI
jgi:hypothetical protein